MSDVHILPAATHGRFLVKPPAVTGDGATVALVGFHGYGQSAGDFLEELERLPGADRCLLVSVQGLHRFYDRRRDRVVASWMTREDRELAIADNLAYVRAVVEAAARAHPFERLVYLGFSQGTAMAVRAAARTGRPCDGVLIVGGDLPSDVVDDPAVSLPRVVIGRGKDDPWYTAVKFAADVERLEERGWLRASVEFEGAHEIGETFRLAAGAVLATLREG